MSFIASSEAWGDQAMARVCKIVMESNDGIGQQVMENQTDLLELMTNDQLMKGDDFGLSVPFLAVYYDQPDIILYLVKKRNIDLIQPCDPMGFGNAMFYAVTLSKPRLIPLLNRLHCSVKAPCETVFSYKPLYYAKRRDDSSVIATIEEIIGKEQRADTLFRKNILKLAAIRYYQKTLEFVLATQRIIRGFIARCYIDCVRKGEVSLDGGSSSHSMSNSNSSGLSFQSSKSQKKKVKEHSFASIIRHRNSSRHSSSLNDNNSLNSDSNSVTHQPALLPGELTGIAEEEGEEEEEVVIQEAAIKQQGTLASGSSSNHSGGTQHHHKAVKAGAAASNKAVVAGGHSVSAGNSSHSSSSSNNKNVKFAAHVDDSKHAKPHDQHHDHHQKHKHHEQDHNNDKEDPHEAAMAAAVKKHRAQQEADTSKQHKHYEKDGLKIGEMKMDDSDEEEDEERHGGNEEDEEEN